MKKISILLLTLIITNCYAQRESKLPASNVDFEAFEKLTSEVKIYRKDRLVSLDDFLKKATEENTIILDTRSTEMYNKKNIKGALHLDFTDFTQENLAKVIQKNTTNILIYCNNNFANDERNFASKVYIPKIKTEKRRYFYIKNDYFLFISENNGFSYYVYKWRKFIPRLQKAFK